MFRGLTLEQAEILTALYQLPGSGEDAGSKIEHSYHVYSRFLAPRSDKHWNGINPEAIRLFSSLKEELNDNQWENAPEIIADFINYFDKFQEYKIEYDRQILVEKKKLEKEVQKAREELEKQKYEIEEKNKKAVIAGYTPKLSLDSSKFCASCKQKIHGYSECYCG